MLTHPAREQVLEQPAPDYVVRGASHNGRAEAAMFARASFYGANPRHNMRLGGSFLRIERRAAATGRPPSAAANKTAEEWVVVADDDDDM